MAITNKISERKGTTMAIAEQFAGLQMDQLIGAPLRAAADASIQLADSTADFIGRVGFDAGGKTRTVAFSYQKRSVNEDGSSNLDEMKVDIPILAIVPIPNLQIDEVNILFDMEVKQSERSESSLDVGATLNASVGFGPVKVNVSGSVSVHQANTRSSDNSAKYHVDVRATNHGVPEGLARVMDMMAANVAPALIGSTLKDGNGQDLPEQARIRAEKLKTLRQEISQIETRLNAARDGLDANVQQMKRLAGTQQNTYHAIMTKLVKALDEKSSDYEEKVSSCNQAMDEVNQTWSTFQNQTADMLKLAKDAGVSKDEVSELFGLKSLSANGDVKTYAQEESCYTGLVGIQNNAVNAQKDVDAIEKELLDKKAEYSQAAASRALLA